MNSHIRRATARMILIAILLLAKHTAAEESKVTLLEPGAEPRTVLAFKPAQDLNQLSRLVIKSSKEQVTGANERMEMNMPGLTLELGCEVTALAEGSPTKVRETLHRAQVTSEPGADPNLLAMFKQTYSQLEGMKSESEIKSSGERIATSSGANPVGGGNVSDVTASFAVIFPSEPIGVGAKWEIASFVDQQGIQLSMKYLYELISLEGNKLSVKVAIDGSAPPREISLPNIPPTAKAELLGARLAGEGTADYDLTRLLPIKAAQVLSNDTKIKVSDATQNMELEQRIKLDQKIEDITELSPKSEAPAQAAPLPSSAAPKPAAPAKPKAGKKKPKTAPN